MTNKIITKENIKKDFEKLAICVKNAKGQHRTVSAFASQCNLNSDDIANVINAKISSYPTISFLKSIASNSEGRVSLKELELACGYSNYANNDIEEIKNIHVERGWLCYADLGSQGVIDSEYGSRRMVLITQNNLGNVKSTTTLICPVTSRKSKSNMTTHVNITTNDCDIPQDSIVSCEQIKCISKRRLIRNNGIVQVVAICSPYLLQRVDVALMKANGTIGLHVTEKDAIEALELLNRGTTKSFEYGKSYNSSGQIVLT